MPDLAVVPREAPTITTTLGEVATAAEALARLSQMVLPGPSAYQIAKLSRLVEAELALLTQQRHALIRELGADRDPTEAERAAGVRGPVLAVLPEHHAAFVQRLEALAAVSVTLPIAPIVLDFTALTIRPADLAALAPFLAP